MTLSTFWQFLHQFDDRDGFALLVFLMFLFGTPLVIGIWANLVVWSARQVRSCRAYLSADRIETL